MAHEIRLSENGFHVLIFITDDANVRLLHFSSLPFEETSCNENGPSIFRLVEIQVTGENQDDHHGLKHTGTLPGKRLRYARHHDTRTIYGRKLEITQQDVLRGLEVTSHLQFFDALPIVRSWTSVRNEGSAAVGLEYVSSFMLAGLTKGGLLSWDEKMFLSIPHNTWCGEGQWRTYALPELGLSKVQTASLKRFACTNTGSWSTSQFLPMGYLENRESGEGLCWQIEHNGSWHWEVSDQADQLYLQISGPTEQEHQWWKQLAPGETFTSVPVAVAAVSTGFTSAIKALTSYRRRIRRPNKDNEALPVIFNDYVVLFGDPTEQKLLPLIEAAAEVGCEYFCIDAGWYADNDWWNTVGDWLPSRQRFPTGLEWVLSKIREKNMQPGLWLELEVMGMDNPRARNLPDNWFFCRHGKRIIDHGRYQLDFRNAQVRAFADEVVDRLVNRYAVGYIKMDYNINIGLGTDIEADSAGDGLLEHNRAYLRWLDTIFARYSELIIENCSSGGMRMDYALLSRHSIQSSSDQSDYRKYAQIATSCLTAVPPEQCAVWSYPGKTDDRETIIFNMVNALLMRIHQSGEIAELSLEGRALVKEGIALYKTIRHHIPQGYPFWPLGLPTFADEWVSLGLACDGPIYLSVWRLQSKADICILPVPSLQGSDVQIECIYPSTQDCRWVWQTETGRLSVALPCVYSARLFRLSSHTTPPLFT
jgi:alpha-galactosidase